jgi:hypothetical protein
LLHLPVIVFSTANEQAKVKMVLGMLHTITFVSLPNLLNLKNTIKAIKLIAEGNLELPKQENFMITGEEKSASDENSPTK